MGAKETLTNDHYVDELILFAGKIPELIYTIDMLHDELAKVGLRENGAKTKLLTTCAINLPPIP